MCGPPTGRTKHATVFAGARMLPGVALGRTPDDAIEGTPGFRAVQSSSAPSGPWRWMAPSAPMAIQPPRGVSPSNSQSGRT
jgi:hypothetical protein